MVREMSNDQEPRWRKIIRIAAFIAGLAGVAAGPVFHIILPKSHVGWSVMIAGLVFMVSSRFDDVVEIGFGSFKTRLERRVQKVEDAMVAVRHLAKASTRNALNAVQFVGRMDGFTEAEKLQFLHDSRQVLEDLGVDEEEARGIESDWHNAVEFDYALWALNHNQVPRDLPPERGEEWRELRRGGIQGRAQPEEIRRFLNGADMLTPEREEILRDYEHYILTQQHRREDAWLRRRER